MKHFTFYVFSYLNLNFSRSVNSRLDSMANFFFLLASVEKSATGRKCSSHNRRKTIPEGGPEWFWQRVQKHVWEDGDDDAIAIYCVSVVGWETVIGYAERLQNVTIKRYSLFCKTLNLILNKVKERATLLEYFIYILE